MISVPKNMYDELDKFFGNKTIDDADKHVHTIVNLRDIKRKITISLIFMRDWDSIAVDSFSSVIMEGTGAVLIFPCYWINVPKELAFRYFTYIIEEFYSENVSKWFGDDDDSSSGSGNGCGNCCPVPNPPAGSTGRPPHHGGNNSSTGNCPCPPIETTNRINIKF